MKQTPQYQLYQWEKMDRILMEDFNRDNAKVDAALAEVRASAAASAATLAQHTAAIAKLGNCQIYTTSYTGNGTYGETNPCSLSFPKPPVVVMIFGGGQWWIGNPDSGLTFLADGRFVMGSCSRTGSTLSWYVAAGNARQQMNYSGTRYYVAALLNAG